MQRTGNLNLKKPEGTDIVDITDLNDNMDILDSEVSRTASTAAPGRMSAADKAKLDGIAAGANNYVHPANHPASIITQDASSRFVTDTEKAAWNAKAGTSVATTIANGLMSSADKSKLDGIAAGAQPNAVTSVAGRTGAVALTKTDVGLASVQNYGIATQAQAEAGTHTTSYMTPQRTKQAIDSLTGSVPLRVQDGQLEYFDGMGWLSVGQPKYEPISIDTSLQTVTTGWSTIYEISGAGRVSRALIIGNYSGIPKIRVRITVDNAVKYIGGGSYGNLILGFSTSESTTTMLSSNYASLVNYLQFVSLNLQSSSFSMFRNWGYIGEESGVIISSDPIDFISSFKLEVDSPSTNMSHRYQIWGSAVKN
ncbi:hypothetical protein [Paenibacillus sp. 1P07SE]|uniref:hypothetical protein n=1 Tax=Paenibacillus sp. 1P07SE TaxID=3132209 RepID=UPI0039A55904